MRNLKPAISSVVAVIMLVNIIYLDAKAALSATFSVSVYSYTENGYIIEQIELTYTEQVSPVKVLCEIEGSETEISGGYIKSAFGLKEKQHGAESGWIYMINGVAPPISAAQYKMKSGDKLDWIYLTSSEQYNIYPPGVSSSQSEASSFNNESQTISSLSSQPYTSDTVPSRTDSSSVYAQSNSVISHQSSYPGSYTSSFHISSPYVSLNSDINNVESLSSSNAAVSQEEILDEGQSLEYSEKAYDERIEAAINKSVQFLNNNLGTWSAIALHSVGADISDDVIKTAEDEYLSAQSSDNITGNIRALLNYAACGKNSDYKNMAMKILNNEEIDKTGVNGPIFALILLCESGIENCRWDKYELSELIVEYQHENGGFSLTKELGPDTDITAMAVTALSIAGTKNAAVEKGLEYLSFVQNSDGSISSMEVSNCESTAQTIIALISSGHSVYDEDFIKNGNSLLDALLSFECGDGFSHIKNGDTDIMATEQTLMALSAVKNSATPYSGIFTDNISSQNITDVIFASAVVIIMLAALAVAGIISYKSVVKDDMISNP